MEGSQTGKKRKKVAAGCSWTGDCGEDGSRTAAAAWRWLLVLNKSKINLVPLPGVHRYVHTNLFCTDAEFAPVPRLSSALAVAWLAGSPAGSCARVYPPYRPDILER